MDDGSGKPLGHQTDDGELEVRQLGDGSVGYAETELGQHMRWMRQAPDLYAKYRALLDAAPSKAQAEPRVLALCPTCAVDGRRTRLHNGACWMHGTLFAGGECRPLHMPDGVPPEKAEE